MKLKTPFSGFAGARSARKEKRLKSGSVYDYGSVAAREDTVAFLLDYSARAKESILSYWRKMARYYDGKCC